MKKTIHARIFALAMAVALFCTGCAARSPVSAEEFETQATAVGFTVETPNVDPDVYPAARSAYDKTIDMQIDFAVCKDQQTATDTYNRQQDKQCGLRSLQQVHGGKRRIVFRPGPYRGYCVLRLGKTGTEE